MTQWSAPGIRLGTRDSGVIRPSHTSLVLIDLQYHDAARGRGFNLAMERLVPGSMQHIEKSIEERVIPTVRQLVHAARRVGMVIAYVQYGSAHRDLRDMPRNIQTRIRSIEQASGVRDIFWMENPDFAVRGEIAPEPGDLIIRKTTFGAFTESELDRELRRRGIDTVVMCGVSTSCCVENSARGAIDRGYRVFLVGDACADYTPRAHSASLANFEMNFGTVLKDADAVEEIVSALDH